MKIRIRREHDVDWMREVYALALPVGSWCHDGDLHWVATDRSELVGFVCARPHGDMLEVTGVGVVASAQGRGMQRRLVRVVEAYARRTGCREVCTYTARDNYASITNFIRSGYRFSPHQRGSEWFNFVKRISC